MEKKYLLGALGLLGLGIAVLWPIHRETSPTVILPSQPASVRNSRPESPAAELNQALKSGSSQDRDRGLDQILPAMMDQDLPAAAKAVEALEPWAWREEALHRIARRWAVKDAAAAAHWATSLQDPDERHTALNDVCVEAAQRDPAQAVDLASRFQMDGNGDTTMEDLLQTWSAKDFSASTSWLSAQPSGEARDRQWLRVTLAGGATHPEEAATLAVTHIPPGPAQEEAVIAVLHQWTLRDPEAAAAWVADFPGGPLRERAEGELAGPAR